MNSASWQAIEATCIRDAGEAIQYGLMEAGALGTETREAGDQTLIIGYYDHPIEKAEVHSALLDALRIYSLAASALIDLKVTEVADRDWLAEWKKGWKPAEVGRFVIAPPWSELNFTPDRIVIRIEPGMAFGTGTHETTRLCLQLIEKYFRGNSALDVGTGTGILAIAAAKMFSNARVQGLDTDGEAIEIARENARLNGVGDQIDFQAGSLTEQTASADLVCANLTAPVIIELLPMLLGATCGRLLLSGILDSQARMVEERLRDLGAASLESRQDGEWIALVV